MALTEAEELELLELENENALAQQGQKPEYSPEAIQKAGQQIGAPMAVPGGPILPGMVMPPTAFPSEAIAAREKAGDALAETSFGQKHPYATAALGTVATRPEAFLGAAEGIADAPALASGLVKTGKFLKNVKDIAFSPTIKKAGQMEGEALAKAGLEVPLEAASDPRTRKAILEKALPSAKAVTNLGKNGVKENLSPQAILDMRTKTKQLLDSLRAGKSWMGIKPKENVAKETLQTLSRSQAILTDALKELEPGVGQAIDVASNAYKRWNMIKYGATGGPVVSALGYALKRLGLGR